MKHINNSLLWIAALFALATISLTTTGCNTQGCTDPNAINYNPDASKDDESCEYDPGLMLHFHSMFGMEDFAFGQEYTFSDGRKINFSVAQFYVSMPTLNGGTPHTFTDGYLLVKADQMAYDLGTFPSGSYSGLEFNVGIDSATNHLDPSTYPDGHPLALQVPSMHWMWSSGYQFVKIEGMVDTTAAGTGAANFPFEFHLGMDQFLKVVELDKSLTADVDGSTMITVMVDWSKFFEDFDWTVDNTTHTMDNMPTAMKLAGNINGAFSLGM